jgi:hypothetical protein
MLPRPSPLLTPTISESSLPSPSVTESAGSAYSDGLVAALAAMISRSLVARPAEVVLVPVHVVLAGDLDPFEVLLHDEVDDARDGIGAVHGRGAARQDVDALDHRGRDLVDVRGDGRGLHTAVGHAPAVDQDQRSVRAEAAQVQGRVPVAAFEIGTFCAAKACGSWLTRSSMRVTPCVTTSAAVTCVTGVVDSRFRASDARAGDDDFTEIFLCQRRCDAGGRQRTHDECAAYGDRNVVFPLHVPSSRGQSANLMPRT